MWKVIDEGITCGDETDYVVAEGVLVLLENVAQRSGRALHETYLESVAWIKILAYEWSTYPSTPSPANHSFIQQLINGNSSTATTTLFIIQPPSEALSAQRGNRPDSTRRATIILDLWLDHGISTDAAPDIVLVDLYEGFSPEETILYKQRTGEEDPWQITGWDSVRVPGETEEDD